MKEIIVNDNNLGKNIEKNTKKFKIMRIGYFSSLILLVFSIGMLKGFYAALCALSCFGLYYFGVNMTNLLNHIDLGKAISKQLKANPVKSESKEQGQYI